MPEEISSKKKLILPLKILLEDEYLAVIHKPAGILVSGNSFKTIANALPQNLKKSTLKDSTKPQPIHRLDYTTTGLLLIGKTSGSLRALNQLFEDKKIAKTYFAIAIGEMKAQEIINLKVDAKKSQTDYYLIDSAPSKRFGRLNLLKITPQTGRRHQIRKHLSAIGNPILGDKEYGMENLVLKGKGLYLHAYSLQFIHPFTQENICVTDELPQKFNKIF